MSSQTYTKKIGGDSIDLFLVFQVERETAMTVGITSDVATISITVFVKTTAKTKNTPVSGKNSDSLQLEGKKKKKICPYLSLL